MGLNCEITYKKFKLWYLKIGKWEKDGWLYKSQISYDYGGSYDNGYKTIGNKIKFDILGGSPKFASNLWTSGKLCNLYNIHLFKLISFTNNLRCIFQLLLDSLLPQTIFIIISSSFKLISFTNVLCYHFTFKRPWPSLCFSCLWIRFFLRRSLLLFYLLLSSYLYDWSLLSFCHHFKLLLNFLYHSTFPLKSCL